MKKRLHIGGQVRTEGWEVIDAIPGPHVDHVGNAKDLSRFDDNTFSDLYASHVLEHFDYGNEINDVLIEWNRVLLPGGRLYISVPDMDTLAQLFVFRAGLSVEDRFNVMRMMFGGHINEFDFHYAGLNQDFLESFLSNAGFINIIRVSTLGLFDDTSNMIYKGVSISLNMVAEKNPP